MWTSTSNVGPCPVSKWIIRARARVISVARSEPGISSPQWLICCRQLRSQSQKLTWIADQYFHSTALYRSYLRDSSNLLLLSVFPRSHRFFAVFVRSKEKMRFHSMYFSVSFHVIFEFLFIPPSLLLLHSHIYFVLWI